MDESISAKGRNKGKSKKLIIFILTGILIIGGSVAAFVLLNLSDKQKYFLAEKNSAEFIEEQIKDRMETELSWQEKTKENPTETTIELAAAYNDPAANLSNLGPAQIINNSTLTIKNALDTEKKKMATEISGDFGGITIDGLNLYLTSEKLLVQLPFLQELLLVNEGDVSKLLNQIDPQTYSGEEKVEFDKLFNGSNVLPEDDQEYLKEEYLKMLYDKLPDSAFKTTDEKIEVNSNTIDAEKITFHLTEKELKDLLITTMEKMKEDERFIEILREQLEMQFLGAGSSLTPSVETNIDSMVAEFDASMEDAINGLEKLQIPDGLTSIIWTNNDLIVKRDFALSMGPSKDKIVTLNVDGTQLFNETEQTFDYKLGFEENGEKSDVTVTGDLSWKDNSAKDSIKLASSEGELTYEGTSTVDDGTKEFERNFTLKTGQEKGGITWTGNAEYQEEAMNAEHEISIQLPGMAEDIVSLQLENESNLVKQVDIPEDSQTKDIGGMDINALTQYIQKEVTPQFQQWLFGILGSGGGLNGF
ncbi:hypothetical protein VBD025_09690 [Virgibacillus flavescens]|uniref:hypothetical protein n=1 Tax=Virgibacillus flavescens TaxID=1611422 RepID=UPI003D32EA31